MAKKRLPPNLMSVKHLRYSLEILNRQDRGITIEGMDGRRIQTGWYVDEENDLAVLRLEPADPGNEDYQVPTT